MIGPIPRALVALAVCVPLPALADALPPRRPGLWEAKTVSDMGTMVAKQCVDEKTDQLAQSAFGGPDGVGKACSKTTVTKTAAGYETVSSCKFGPMTTEGKGVVTGDFNASIRMEISTTLGGIPGQDKPVTSKTVIENRWIGPCEAGQKPGDIIMGDGKVFKTPGTGR